MGREPLTRMAQIRSKCAIAEPWGFPGECPCRSGRGHAHVVGMAIGESLLQQAGATTSVQTAGAKERRYRPQDEANRADHPACQSGDRSRDRRLFRVVEPGSVAATAAALVSRSRHSYPTQARAEPGDGNGLTGTADQAGFLESRAGR